ncbi:MAG: transposase, partial [Puniceicoccales bacterium]|nr:transposase [Puniceicoccales bacterium]
LALWPGRNFIGRTSSLGMSMARPLPNVFTIATECVYDYTTDGEVFNAWVKQSLVVALKPGQVILMDNGAFHKHPRTREAIEAAGCSLIYLLPYSPDLNPIEKF